MDPAFSLNNQPLMDTIIDERMQKLIDADVHVFALHSSIVFWVCMFTSRILEM